MASFLQRIREAIEGALDAAIEGVGGAGEAVRHRWSRVPAIARRRTAAGLGLAAASALIWLVVLPLGPCQVPGGDRCAPEDETIAHVPGDALGYLHADLASDAEQGERASQLFEQLPILSRQLLVLLPRLPGQGVDFNRDVRPWSGGEVAMASLPLAGDRAETVFLLESIDDAGAREFAVTNVGGASRLHEEVEVLSGRGAAAAIVDGFLVIGARPAVERMIDFSAGEEESLAKAEALDALLDGLADDYLAYAYLAPERAGTVLDDAGLGFLAALVNPDATDGAAATIEVLEDGKGLELAVASQLDPDRAERSPGFLAALQPFEPGIEEVIDSDLLAMIDIGNPAAAATALLSTAISESPGLVDGVRGLERSLRQAGLDLEEQVLPLLGEETAVTIAEPPQKEGQDPELIDPLARPVFSLIATGVDEEAAREGLARLQTPIARAIDPQIGPAPVFEEREVDGATVQSLVAATGFGLNLGVFDERLVVTTDDAGIDRAHGEVDALGDADAFKRATDGFDEEPSLLAFVNLSDGITFLGQQGFGEDPAFALLAPDLVRLEALALTLNSSGERLTSRLRLTVGDEPAPADPGEAAPPSLDPPSE